MYATDGGGSRFFVSKLALVTRMQVLRAFTRLDFYVTAHRGEDLPNGDVGTPRKIIQRRAGTEWPSRRRAI